MCLSSSDRLLKRLDDFSAPPFTIQRLCELLLGTSPYAAEPRKYVFAVEKLVYVSSTIPVLAPADYDSTVVALDKAMRAAAEQARIAAEATAAAIASAAASGASSVATRRPAAADDVDMS
jgi:hypothetical protein